MVEKDWKEKSFEIKKNNLKSQDIQWLVLFFPFFMKEYS